MPMPFFQSFKNGKLLFRHRKSGVVKLTNRLPFPFSVIIAAAADKKRFPVSKGRKKNGLFTAVLRIEAFNPVYPGVLEPDELCLYLFL